MFVVSFLLGFSGFLRSGEVSVGGSPQLSDGARKLLLAGCGACARDPGRLVGGPFNFGQLFIGLVLNQTNCVSLVLGSALRGDKSLLGEANALVNEA